jgi:hypothetical protein
LASHEGKSLPWVTYRLRLEKLLSYTINMTNVINIPVADLRGGWTQEQLAARENKGHSWVSYRLRFGRFVAYVTNITPVIRITINELTEGRFRGYWERTSKGKGGETARFDAVIRLMQASRPRRTRAHGGGRYV